MRTCWSLTRARGVVFIFVLYGWIQWIWNLWFQSPSATRTIRNLSTGYRRVIAKVRREKYPAGQKTPNMTTPGHSSTTVIDNHADTSVVGVIFHLIAFSGKVCDVSPFSDKYEATMNVKIATCTTIVARVLIINQILWFGNQMTMSLLQPNQWRAYSINLSDDPTYPNRTLGILVSEDFFIPFQAKGPTMLFTSRCPTGEELYKIRRTVLTDDDWDPTQPFFTGVD